MAAAPLNGGASPSCMSCARPAFPLLWPATMHGTNSTPMATLTCLRCSTRWAGCTSLRPSWHGLLGSAKLRREQVLWAAHVLGVAWAAMPRCLLWVPCQDSVWGRMGCSTIMGCGSLQALLESCTVWG